MKSTCRSQAGTGRARVILILLLSASGLWAQTTDDAINRAREQAKGKAPGKISDDRKEAADLNKAALRHLDREIYILTLQIDTLGESAYKAELQKRLEGFKLRRGELASRFHQIPYDALIADVRSEWSGFAR